MKRKIILTGSKGFVGKNVFEYFKKKNIHIIKTPTKSFLTKKNHLNNITHILHVGFDMRKNNVNVKSQLKILKNICSQAKKNNTKIIFLSSSCFGPSNKRKIFVKSSYQLAKKKCEDFLIKYRKKKLDSIILRIFNLYGPGQNEGFIISDAISKVNKNEEIELYNHKNFRDFIFIEDLVEAIYKCVKFDINNKTLEIGSGKSYSVKFIYNLVSSLLKKKIKFSFKKPYNSIPKHTKALVRDNKKLINWYPKTDIKKGIKLTIKSYEKDIDII